VAKRIAQRASTMINPQRRGGAKDVSSSDIEQTMNMERISNKIIQ
jgi:hypothetical protein